MNILVTGGASGLGAAITKKLASEVNNFVYFTYNQSIDQAQLFESLYSNVKGLKCDFTLPAEVDSLCEKVTTFDLQVLVNNATTGFQQNYFHKIKVESFAQSFLKNVLPVIQITQSAILNFRKNKFGKIITVLSSAVVNKPPVGWSEYVANKNYLHSLSKSWAIENAAFNISSNCISPSFMITSLTADTDERIVEQMVTNHPLKKLVKPEEVADSVAYFVGASQQINGSNLIINAAENVI